MSNELQRLNENIKSLIEATRAPVDIHYSADSENAQSGVAVTEAINIEKIANYTIVSNTGHVTTYNHENIGLANCIELENTSAETQNIQLLGLSSNLFPIPKFEGLGTKGLTITTDNTSIILNGTITTNILVSVTANIPYDGGAYRLSRSDEQGTSTINQTPLVRIAETSSSSYIVNSTASATITASKMSELGCSRFGYFAIQIRTGTYENYKIQIKLQKSEIVIPDYTPYYETSSEYILKPGAKERLSYTNIYNNIYDYYSITNDNINTAIKISFMNVQSLNKLLHITNSPEIATEEYVDSTISSFDDRLEAFESSNVLVSSTEPPQDSNAIWIKPSYAVADYITELGGMNDWMYEKYSSGKIILYLKRYIDSVVFSTETNIYKSELVEGISYPTLLTGVLDINITALGNDATSLFVAKAIPTIDNEVQSELEYTPNVVIYHTDSESQCTNVILYYKIVGIVDNTEV